MRLSPHEVAAIKAAARDAFGPEAVVRLFGSRVDDARRGGDIDLHVEVADHAGKRREVMFRRLLMRAMEDHDVDVVVAVHGAPRRWIDDAAMRGGVVL